MRIYSKWIIDRNVQILSSDLGPQKHMCGSVDLSWYPISTDLIGIFQEAKVGSSVFNENLAFFFFSQEMYHKRMDTHIGIAETTSLFTWNYYSISGYNPMKLKKFKKKKNK